MENNDLKIGLSMLDDIEGKLDRIYGNTVAWTPITSIDSFEDVNIRTTKELIKDLKIARKKIGDSKQGQAKAAFIMGKICAVGFDMISLARIQLKCMKHYEEALELGYDEATVKYYMAKHKDAWDKKKDAIELYERVVELSGLDDPNGMDSAKQIERLKEKKGGCFIATAVYGSYDAPEVLILRKFRDEILLTSKIGQIFVRIYYFLSPSFAGYLKKRNKLKGVIREKILSPFVIYIDNKFSK